MRYYWDYDADSKRIPNIGLIPYPGPRGWFSLDPQSSYPGLNPGFEVSLTHISLSRIFHGAVTYKNGELERINLPEGYISPNGTFNAYYHDYQGNVRAVGTGGEYGTPLQITHYYPYGLPFAEGLGASVNRYKYTGKELITEDNLNFYDFEARMYQPQSAMWMRPDDLAEKKYWFSPYSFCRSNPVFYIDPSGCLEWPVPNEYNGAKGRRHEDNFGKPRGKYRTHQGIDINIGSRNEDLGAPVSAAHDGKVKSIKSYKDGNAGGNRIVIESTDGKVSTSYMHLNEVNPDLKVGDPVREGTVIGTVGASHYGQHVHETMKAHLHYEIRINGQIINPTNGKSHLVDPQQLLSSSATFEPLPPESRCVQGPEVIVFSPPKPLVGTISRVKVPEITVTPDAAILNN